MEFYAQNYALKGEKLVSFMSHIYFINNIVLYKAQ